MHDPAWTLERVKLDAKERIEGLEAEVRRLRAALDSPGSYWCQELREENERLRSILQRIYDDAGYVKEDVWWDIVKELTGEDPPPPDVWDRYKAMLERLAEERREEK